uniref:WD repeat-containing protein 60 n=1 Tax=Clastoptera arizonana TaxID=38151 RepID=A0A1B6DU89_9HEMI
MSKRGGASEVNGFVSINTDDKKSTVNRKNPEKTKKVVKDGTPSKSHRDSSRDKGKDAKTLVKEHQPIAGPSKSRQRVSLVEKAKNEIPSPLSKPTVTKSKTNTVPRTSKKSENITNTKGKTEDNKPRIKTSSSRNIDSHHQISSEPSKLRTSTINKSKPTDELNMHSRTSKATYQLPLTKQSTFTLPETQAIKTTKGIKHTSSMKSAKHLIDSVQKRRKESHNVATEKPSRVKEQYIKNEVSEDLSETQHKRINKSFSDHMNKSENHEESVNEESYDYEDDFEDYESDFEEYTSEETTDSLSEENTDVEPEPQNSELKTDVKKSNVKEKDTKQTKVEEERKLDSGSYDLSSNADLRRKKQIQEIKDAILKENEAVKTRGNLCSSPVDEGFEDENKCGETEVIEKNGLINFEDARQFQLKQKVKEKMKRRGERLLEMIKLDTMSFDLFDLPSFPYEVYIKCYGKSNTQQMHSQTGEDDISEETQTEEITTCNKWTQHPVSFSSPDKMNQHEFIQTFSQERLGVGGEMTLLDNQEWLTSPKINSIKLNEFISSAGEVMLILLEESERDLEKSKGLAHNKQDFGFSDGFVEFKVGDVSFLKNRPINVMCFSQSNYAQLLSVHQSSNEQPKNIEQESKNRCMLCVWSVLEPSSPQKILVSSNEVTSVTFHSYLVIAGLVDGSLCLWDLREKSDYHIQTLASDKNWLLRSPTYITAGILTENGHHSTVVAVQILPDASGKVDRLPTQVISLDRDGLLIVWTVIEGTCTLSPDLGLAHWGKVRLVPSSYLSVLESYTREERSKTVCTCFAIDLIKPSNLYIGTNRGQVLHCMQATTKTRPPYYETNSGELSNVTCLEFSRCGHPTLLVGDNEGRIRVYRTSSKQPLLNLFANASSLNSGVKSIQMSANHPGLFFVLDSKSCIHVWDLCIGDIYPQLTVPFDNQISAIQLSQHVGANQMALATTTGQIQIHHLKTQFCQQTPDMTIRENMKYEKYVSIL